VELSTMTAVIAEASPDGRPLAVRFELGSGRRDEAPLILTWKQGRFSPMPIPDEGATTTLPEEDFGKILLAALL
jgi:hypothetical protein